jgi:hypothetical protein
MYSNQTKFEIAVHISNSYYMYSTNDEPVSGITVQFYYGKNFTMKDRSRLLTFNAITVFAMLIYNN